MLLVHGLIAQKYAYVHYEYAITSSMSILHANTCAGLDHSGSESLIMEHGSTVVLHMKGSGAKKRHLHSSNGTHTRTLSKNSKFSAVIY